MSKKRSHAAREKSNKSFQIRKIINLLKINKLYLFDLWRFVRFLREAHSTRILAHPHYVTTEVLHLSKQDPLALADPTYARCGSLYVGLKKSYAFGVPAPGGGRAAFRWRSTMARPYRLVRQAFVGTRQSGRKAASARPQIGVGSPPGHLRLCQNKGVTLRERNLTNRSKYCKPCVLKTEKQKSSQEHKLTFCVFIMRQKHGANG